MSLTEGVPVMARRDQKKEARIEDATGGFIITLTQPNMSEDAKKKRAKSEYVERIEEQKVAANVTDMMGIVVEFFGGNMKMKNFGLQH
jgi:hypothetical protein